MERVGSSGEYSSGNYNVDGSCEVRNFGMDHNGLMKAGTLVAGAITGGAAAALSKGYFWEGAVTGLFVAGFNHLGNHNGSFDKEIDKAFGERADSSVPNPSKAEIYSTVNKLPTLRKFYNKFLKKFGKVDLEYGDVLLSDNAKTIPTENYSSLEIVMFYRGSMESYRVLSKTILHEFGHVNSIYKRFLFSNVNKYTPKTAISIDEIYAFKFANYHGGVPYLNNPQYKSNVDFLKGTTWKINANSINLPSFD